MLFETRDLPLIDRANERFAAGELQTALGDLDQALGYLSTPHAHWNRSQVLLALGDYQNGFSEHEWRWALFPGLLDANSQTALGSAPQWTGKDIRGKELLLYHEGGYGDAIMLLRYVPRLQDMGINVTLLVPPALRWLAEQFDTAVIERVRYRFDYRCPMFSIPVALRETFESVPLAPYLAVDPSWDKPIRDDGRKKIGICWSSERPQPVERLIGIDELVAALPDCQLYSLQNNAQDEGERTGVQTFQFTDFAELAALIDRMDAIVAIDTAALNLAGAIGHNCVNALLPFMPVWRWHNPRWYPQVNQCRQDRPGDWPSALQKLKL